MHSQIYINSPMLNILAVLEDKNSRGINVYISILFSVSLSSYPYVKLQFQQFSILPVSHLLFFLRTDIHLLTSFLTSLRISFIPDSSECIWLTSSKSYLRQSWSSYPLCQCSRQKTGWHVTKGPRLGYHKKPWITVLRCRHCFIDTVGSKPPNDLWKRPVCTWHAPYPDDLPQLVM